MSSGIGHRFGRHVRSLRRARGVTQERLAELSRLSPDTVRRLEHGAFSPSLETLHKLCAGLDVTLSTLFETFELNDNEERKLLLDLIASRPPREVAMLTRLVRALIAELEGLAARDDEGVPVEAVGNEGNEGDEGDEE